MFKDEDFIASPWIHTSHDSRFVAAPFMDSNVQAVKVRQIRDELKKMETKAADVSITEGNSCSGPPSGIYM